MSCCASLNSCPVSLSRGSLELGHTIHSKRYIRSSDSSILQGTHYASVQVRISNWAWLTFSYMFYARGCGTFWTPMIYLVHFFLGGPAPSIIVPLRHFNSKSQGWCRVGIYYPGWWNHSTFYILDGSMH